jgi:hypothetical protein
MPYQEDHVEGNKFFSCDKCGLKLSRRMMTRHPQRCPGEVAAATGPSLPSAGDQADTCSSPPRGRRKLDHLPDPMDNSSPNKSHDDKSDANVTRR